jgi:DNA-binding transcriptional MerR regulator
METKKNMDSDNQTYRIGAVSKLTGIRPDTLRIWERRYNVVEPSRTVKGGRLYSRDDVSRLMKIKTLVDQGHAISTLVSLDEDQLHQRLSQHAGIQIMDAAMDTRRVCVVGGAIGIRLQYADKPSHIDLAGIYENAQELVASGKQCDSLVLEIPVIDADSVKLIDQYNLRQLAAQIIVVYAFGQSQYLSQLGRYAANVLKAPVSDNLIWQTISSPLPGHQPIEVEEITINSAELEVIPPRLFTSQQLAYCAGIESKLKCECPHHMSQMIETMVAFEQYSASCENLTADDAALHNYLHVMTAKARHMMETALTTLLEAEDIDVTERTRNINN